MLNLTVLDDENICRFIFSSGHHNTTRAKWGGFEPNKGEVSVLRTGVLTSADLLQVGHEISEVRKQSLKCWVEFIAVNVRTLKYPDQRNMQLDIIPEPTPHPNHANIKDLSKTNNEDWLEEAKILAANLPMTLKSLPTDYVQYVAPTLQKNKCDK